MIKVSCDPADGIVVNKVGLRRNVKTLSFVAPNCAVNCRQHSCQR